MTAWTLIDNQAQLQSLVAQWQQQPALAFDTEFVRTKTFYPRIGLVQIADESQVWLLDPFLVDDLKVLAPVLTNPKVVKVMHACSEDIELFQHTLGVIPVNCWDTQIAAGLLGQGASLGLIHLLAEQMSVYLSKSQTQSDWCARPLTQAQLDYAALDVKYLLPVYRKQWGSLHHKKRDLWVVEDTELLMASALPEPDERAYLRIKGGWALKGKHLWYLQQLMAWREQQAKLKDIPRGFVIKDRLALELAEKMPSHKSHLNQLADMPPWLLRHQGDWLVQLAADAATVDRKQWPERIPGPLPSGMGPVYKACRKKLGILAMQLGTPEECINKRKPLELLLRLQLDHQSDALPRYYQGWRRALVAQPLLEIIQQHKENL